MGSRQKWMLISFASAVVVLPAHARRFQPQAQELPLPPSNGMLQAQVKEQDLLTGAAKHKRFSNIPLQASRSCVAAGKARAPLSGQTKSVLYKAFLKMNCQEFTLLNANYYSADRNYKFVAARQALADHQASQPTFIDTKIGGKLHTVQLALPQFSGGEIWLYTDGNHLLGLEPRTLDAWVWQPPGRKGSLPVGWHKLTHIKK